MSLTAVCGLHILAGCLRTPAGSLRTLACFQHTRACFVVAVGWVEAAGGHHGTAAALAALLAVAAAGVGGDWAAAYSCRAHLEAPPVFPDR